MIRKMLFFITLVHSCSFLHATSTTQKKMKAHLDTIYHILEDGYAPAEWKKEFLGWDLNHELEIAKNEVDTSSNITVKDFQKIVRRFLNSMHDLHVSALFHSTEFADLPFTVKGANGRYFVVHVDEERLSREVYNMSIGDELISFDGKDPHVVVLELQKERMQTADEGVDRAFAEMNLTRRMGAFAQDVPNGGIEIGLKKNGTDKTLYYQLAWNYEPEFVTNHYKLQPTDDEKNSIFNLQMISAYDDYFMKIFEKSGKRDTAIGARKSFIPKLGKIWWTSNSENNFYAYIYEYQGHLIGYIRIPNYRGGKEEEEEFREIIGLFEERTDALIIDQVNNPGGGFFYMSALASVLTNQPLYMPKQRISINQSDVEEAASIIPDLEKVSSDEEALTLMGNISFGNPVTYQTVKFLLGFYRFILDEWKAGKTLTSPFYLGGLDQINPNPNVNYSKPILILVNELSVSCADFFPAILQDNKRAIVMGGKTSGAGGFLCSATFPNLFGLKMLRYTGSIALRIDKSPIENLGVTPDIPYRVTESDLQNSYFDYSKKINETILEMCDNR